MSSVVQQKETLDRCIIQEFVMTRNNRKLVWLAVLVVSFAVVLFLLGSLFGIVKYQQWLFETNIQMIRVGDSKERVLELLGEPQKRFAKGRQIEDEIRKKSLLLMLFTSESPETWVYGSWSLLRLGRTDKDYAVEFDEQGHVSRIVFPTRPDN